MAKVKVIKALLKGIGSLFKQKGEDVPLLFRTRTKDPDLPARSFFTHLIDDFGEAEVKESVDIVKGAWKRNEFFPGGPKGASFEDDLVNLLETRHFGSQRIQASPINFNRRGPGAADRYKMPKMGEEDKLRNIRRTDLPGGPGDPDLYKNHWGEMSGTVRTDGTKVWTSKPSIVDEYADDVVNRIKNNANVSPEDINMAYDNKMMARIRAAADEQLAPMKLQSKQMNAAARQIDDMSARMEEFSKKGDWESAGKIQKAIEEFRLQVQKDRGMLVDEFPMLIDPTRKPNAAGGRVGMFKGGLLALLKRINPRLEKKMVETGPFQTGHRGDAVADMEQIKNITRNEATDLERIYELEDMIQKSPRYNEKMKAAFMELIDYEKFRANKLYDNPKLQKHMKNDPEGTEDYLRRWYKSEGSDSGFNMGGRVGYAEGNIVEPTGYVSPSEMKTAAGYLSPYAMMTDAGYEPTNIDQAEELKRRLGEASPVYEMLFDALERETAASGGRIGLKGGGNREFESDVTAKLPEGGMASGPGWQPWMTNRAVQGATVDAGYSPFQSQSMPGLANTEVKGNAALQNARTNALHQAKSNFLNTGWAPKPLWLNQGGRVGMFAGGKLLGEGIMQAAKLAQKGIRPWGSKQVHRQKVTKKGASNFDTIDEITKTDVASLVDAEDPNSLINMYEEILTGKRFGLLSDPQRNKILQTIEDGLQKIPMGKGAAEDLGADLFNLRSYYGLTAPKEHGGAKIIPFPRKKKAMGGQIGVGSLFRSK